MFSHEIKYYKHALRIYLNKFLSRECVADDKYAAVAVEVSGVCNLECVFCAYKEKNTGKVVMQNEDFFDRINQLADLGHNYLVLTPQTGDVFVDKHFMDKIEFLEQHSKIQGYEFITNLITASEIMLNRLSEAKKLTRMYISLYGHNLENFKKITGRPETQYRRLIKNLHHLAELAPGFHGILGACVMTNRDFNWSPHSTPSKMQEESDVLAAVMLVAQRDDDFYWSGNHVDFDSWGGRISQQDVDLLDLGFRVVGPAVPMTGPCGMLFGGAVVLADGRVNACGCRAVGNGLIIGDSTTTPLREILSPDNPLYVNILEKHMKGDYPADCAGCKIFTSIYRKPHGRPVTTIKEHLAARRQRYEQAGAGV